MSAMPEQSRWEHLRQTTERRLRRVFRPLGRRVDPVDFRDRISIATWLLVFGMGISLLLELPSTILTFSALGSPMSITLNARIFAGMFLAVLAAASTESVISVHPRFAGGHASRVQIWLFWALPMAITLIAGLLLPQAPNREAAVLSLLVTGGFLAMAFFGLYATVESGQPGYRRSRLLLDALAYGSALLLFLLVYQTRIRSLVSGTLIAATATLLAIELLRGASNDVKQVLSYGMIVGLVLGEVTWALNYWLLPELTGGLLLLLIFYLLTGVAQQGLRGRLNRRVAIEFALFGAAVLILIAVVGPRLS